MPPLTFAGRGSRRQLVVPLAQLGEHVRDRRLAPPRPRAIEPHRLDDQARRDVVLGAVDDLDRVARPQLALLGDREVGARAAGVQELLLEAAYADPRLELEAGDARAGDPQLDRADPPALADPRARDVDARSRQVLAERPGVEVESGDVAPEHDVLARIGVDRLVGAAVDRAVGLVVALQVDAADGDRALDRRLDDRRLDHAAAGDQGRGAPHIDRNASHASSVRRSASYGLSPFSCSTSRRRSFPVHASTDPSPRTSTPPRTRRGPDNSIRCATCWTGSNVL